MLTHKLELHIIELRKAKNMDIKTIMEITELTKEEIEKL